MRKEQSNSQCARRVTMGKARLLLTRRDTASSDVTALAITISWLSEAVFCC
jgi:hypothetical protein